MAWKEVATLDYFSRGRFLFGIGAGWNTEETEIMRGHCAHRWTQTREAIEAMKALWAHEAAEYHGTYYDFPLVRSFPRLVQQPHPPILLGGSAQQVFKRIVAYGNGWMPTRSTPELIWQGRTILNELAVEAGRDPTSIAGLAYIAPTDRAVLQALAEAGADAAVVRLEGESKAAALAELEQIAQKVLRGRRRTESRQSSLQPRTRCPPAGWASAPLVCLASCHPHALLGARSQGR